MAIQTSGQIAMSDIMTELGISGQTAINDADVRGLIDKTSGAQMSMSEWYGAADVFAFNITSSAQSGLTLSTLATAAGWDGTTSVEATINSGVILNTITPNTAALTVNIANSTIINNGSITGKGGALGNSNPGGHAMSVTVSGISVQNNSGAFIAGGGGSGSGSQGGGGAGEADTPGTTTVAASTQATTSCYDGRGCSAVTGACLITKKEVFDGINGFDDDFDVYYGDTDLCLKIINFGLSVLYTPNVKLLHEGSHSIKSKMNSNTLEKNQAHFAVENHHRFINKWPKLKNGDPFYNRNLGWNFSIKSVE